MRLKRISIITLSCLLIRATQLYAQTIPIEPSRFEPVNVSMAINKIQGKEAIKVVKDPSVNKFDEPTFVKIKDFDFKNGTIEVKVLSRLLNDAPEFARGFIGIAFRINEKDSEFESIYLRPTNARAEDQVRRNHTIQYFSYPDHKFDRLRKEEPEKYESYTDMALDEWITMKISVDGTEAKLYLNNNEQPSLIVNDLKMGANASGAIGLWVDIGTEGYFSELKVIHQK
ncbi:MAG TPA: hypothetical protein VK921_19115 [Anditalea sp.]|nr:hypothetical protein [Anditalea sp.]